MGQEQKDLNNERRFHLESEFGLHEEGRYLYRVFFRCPVALCDDVILMVPGKDRANAEMEAKGLPQACAHGQRIVEAE